jgi:hypothetical protein
VNRRATILVGIAVPVVVALCFPVVAHFRAKAAAERFKAQLRAQGEKLSIAELVPRLPEAGANGASEFLAAQARLSAMPHQIQPTAMRGVRPGRARIAWQQPVLPTDQSSNVWPELRACVAKNSTALGNLRAALRQPVLQFQVNYHQGFSTPLRHLAQLKSASQTLSCSMLLALRDQRTDEAFEDLRAMVALPARHRDEPFMISQLVRYAIVAIAASATWEALHYPHWRDEQLAQLQAAWEEVDVLRGLDASLSMERACVLEEYPKCRDSLKRFDQLGSVGGVASNPFEDVAEIGATMLENPAQGFEALVERFPRRWVWKWWNGYEDEIWFLQSHQRQLNAARRFATHEPFVPLREEVRAESVRLGDPPKQFILARLLGADLYFKQAEKAAVAETQRRLVLTAIALRRFERRHGKPAASLSALMPEFLPDVPRDPMDGQPLRYQPTDGHSFVLYSVGSDGQDGGGDVRPPNPTSKSFWWTAATDWVWPAPAPDDEVRQYHKSLRGKGRSGK